MSLVGGISYFFSDEIKVPYFKAALYSLVGVLLGACIFVGITMLVVKQFGKAEMPFKKAICVNATKSAAVLPFLAAGTILCLFSIGLGVIVASVGGILAYFYVHTALNDGSIQDENKRVYTAFLIYALYVIVIALLMYLKIKIK